MTARHATWQQQHQTHHVAQTFLVGLLGGFHAYQYTIKQPHGSFSVQVEGDTQPAGMTTRVATLSSTKTVRSIEKSAINGIKESRKSPDLE